MLRGNNHKSIRHQASAHTQEVLMKLNKMPSFLTAGCSLPALSQGSVSSADCTTLINSFPFNNTDIHSYIKASRLSWSLSIVDRRSFLWSYSMMANTPVDPLFRATLNSANHMAAVQCIEWYIYRWSTSVEAQIKHPKGGKWVLMVVGARWAGLSVLESAELLESPHTAWEKQNYIQRVSVSSVSGNA